MSLLRRDRRLEPRPAARRLVDIVCLPKDELRRDEIKKRARRTNPWTLQESDNQLLTIGKMFAGRPGRERNEYMKTIDSNLPPPIKNPSSLRRLLNRVCHYETMSGNGACPVYLERWTMIEAIGCGIYLHHFLGDDWALDPHDHPRRFISIGLRGWYWEDFYGAGGELKSSTCYKAPWIRSFPAKHLHRVRAAECGNCWTLVVVLRKSRPWGFVQEGVWIPFRNYVFGGKYRKAC